MEAAAAVVSHVTARILPSPARYAARIVRHFASIRATDPRGGGYKRSVTRSTSSSTRETGETLLNSTNTGFQSVKSSPKMRKFDVQFFRGKGNFISDNFCSQTEANICIQKKKKRKFPFPTNIELRSNFFKEISLSRISIYSNFLFLKKTRTGGKFRCLDFLFHFRKIELFVIIHGASTVGIYATRRFLQLETNVSNDPPPPQ